MKIFSIGASAFLFSAMTIVAENIVFPEGSSFVDITKAPYNAPSDGVGDATDEINKALKDNIGSGKSIYFPNGTYLISNSLVFPNQANGNLPSNLTLQGQSRDGSIIKLKDASTGFTNSGTHKALIVTGHDVAQCFDNSISNLTINTGKGNPGAIGLRYYSNNAGTAQNIMIVSGDGDGAIGLDFYWQNENGPLFTKNISIEGFKIGVNAGSCQNSQTMENITLRNQKECGIKTGGGVLSIHNLQSENSVPALINNDAIVTLIGLRCTGGSSASAAVTNTGTLYIRDFSAIGYARGIDNTGGNKKSLAALSVSEWSSHDQISLGTTGTGMLKLPIKETPETVWDPVTDWIVVNHLGDGTDATSAIQTAIDAGKTTVYFKAGNYKVDGIVHVRSAVRTLYGFGSYLDVQPTGGFIVDAGTAPTVIFENFGGGYAHVPFLTHASTRTLVLKNMVNWGIKKNAGSGDLFLEDICANPWNWFEFHGGNVWARQFNPENEGTHTINDNTNLWILGMKTERGGTLIDTKAGGKTELCGFFCYTTVDPKNSSMFIVNESEFSVIGAETAYGSAYSTLVEEIKNGTTRKLSASSLPGACGGGHVLPLFVSKTAGSNLIYNRPVAKNGVRKKGAHSHSIDLAGRRKQSASSSASVRVTSPRTIVTVNP